jgi:hypothetical protein
MIRIKVVEKIKTRFVFSKFFSAKIVPFMRYSGKCGTGELAKVYGTAGLAKVYGTAGLAKVYGTAGLAKVYGTVGLAKV